MMGLWVCSNKYIVLPYTLYYRDRNTELLVQDTDDFSTEVYTVWQLVGLIKKGLITFENFVFYGTCARLEPFFAAEKLRTVGNMAFYLKRGSQSVVTPVLHLLCGGMHYEFPIGGHSYMPDFQENCVNFHSIMVLNDKSLMERYDFSIPYENASSVLTLSPSADVTDADKVEPMEITGIPCSKSAFMSGLIMGV